jgi:predicted metal-binding protein
LNKETTAKRAFELERFAQRACELGALEAKIIPAHSVVTAAWVRLKCQFGCGGYNNSHCCPPRTPTPVETQEAINGYTRALLARFDGNGHPSLAIIELEREIFLQGFYKALGFGDGPCRLCETCNLEKCAHPAKARPSMEACGIDVYATAHANGYPIEVLRDRDAQGNYYGLVLID